MGRVLRDAVGTLLVAAAGALLSLTVMHGAQAVEVNTASQAELERVKGIGVALSEALLAERARRPFADWADLRARVGGIGRAQAARLSGAGLTVAGRPYAAEAAAGVVPQAAPASASTAPAATPSASAARPR